MSLHSEALATYGLFGTVNNIQQAHVHKLSGTNVLPECATFDKVRILSLELTSKCRCESVAPLSPWYVQVRDCMLTTYISSYFPLKIM